MTTTSLSGLRPCLLVSVLVVTAQPPIARAAAALRVEAGDYERSGTVVSFQLPAGTGPFNQLEDEKGLRVPLQVEPDGRATFVLASLARGATHRFRLTHDPAAGESAQPRVKAERAGSAVRFLVDGRPALQYQAEMSELPRVNLKPIFRRGGYLHPVYSPSGLVVTDDYPPNHQHHHGIWFPWTKTEFEGRTPDFWNMGEGKGTVEFVAVDGFWSGHVHGGLRARHRFVDLTAPSPKTVLLESWEVRTYRMPPAPRPYHLFDLVSTQQCATASPLKLPEYHYGGLGVRGHWDWNGKEHTTFLTSSGETDRVKGNTTRGRWCHMGGQVGGQPTGLAILDHPGNFRAPQPMRLHPSEPFFCYAPSQLGDWSIEPGTPYVSRYRFVVFDGPADREWIERLWNDYAHPPKVVLVALD
ncbi:MAG TPA: PmoA family protein [Methylomirabilota bacterium]|nr:PmoA family protein [Methylomirabilota bacterium]